MGTTVIGGLGPGLGQSVNPFDPDWIKQQTRSRSEQPIVDTLNANAAAKYAGEAHNKLEQNIMLQAAGQPLLPIDPPPYKIVLDAQANQVPSNEYVTAPLSVIPPRPSTAGAGLSAGQFPKSAVSAPDRTDQLIAILRDVIYPAITAIHADMAAVKTKLGI